MKNHHCKFQIVSDTVDGVKEVCMECKRVLVSKKDSHGRIDTKKWLLEHVRDTAQPSGRTKNIFNKYYGKNNKPT